MTKWAGTQLSSNELKEMKRKLIIRQAASTFNRRGSQGATLEDVAAQLKISKAALYRYVSNKKDLLLACHLEAVRIAQEAADSADRLGESGWMKIHLSLKRHLENMIQSLGVPSLILEDNSLDEESMEMIVTLRDAYEGRLRSFYEEGVKDGSVIPGNAKVAVFAMLGALNWTAKWYQPDGEWKPEEISEAIVEVVTRGISARPRERLLSTLHNLPRKSENKLTKGGK